VYNVKSMGFKAKKSAYETVIVTLAEKIESLQDALRIANETIVLRDEMLRERERVVGRTFEEMKGLREQFGAVMKENEELRRDRTAQNVALQRLTAKVDRLTDVVKGPGRRRTRSAGATSA
jgi:chromosome segregation ATPase